MENLQLHHYKTMPAHVGPIPGALDAVTPETGLGGLKCMLISPGLPRMASMAFLP
jgi:hypothetical protein